jgi:thioredoxin-related protein
MRKFIYILVVFFWVIPSGFAQLETHSFEEVEQLSKENPKPIVVFIHTSWCKYCKIMENATFKNPSVISTLNENFYFISFDAETKEKITFNQHTFSFKPTGNNTGIHELATALASIENQVVYPTVTILGTDNAVEFQQHSYINAKAFLQILEKMK